MVEFKDSINWNYSGSSINQFMICISYSGDSLFAAFRMWT